MLFEDRKGDMLYYIYNGDELLGFVYKNKTYYYHKNMSGDIIGILDSNYNEIVIYEYDSWGALVNITDNSNINLGTINPFRYRSYYYDEETQLYYLNSRYYNPQVGRFINADGYVSTGQEINSTNMFMYCGNNPIGRKDSSGRWWKFAVVAIIAVAITVVVTKAINIIKEKEQERIDKYGAARKYVPQSANSRNNCYSYALGNIGTTNPGIKSGVSYTPGDVYSVGNAVEADLKSMGRSVRQIDGPSSDINPDEYRIALRVGTKPYEIENGIKKYDYHFMVQTSTGQWAEKHGGSETIIWDKGFTPNDISWDLPYSNGDVAIKGYYDSDIIYFAVSYKTYISR